MKTNDIDRARRTTSGTDQYIARHDRITIFIFVGALLVEYHIVVMNS